MLRDDILNTRLSDGQLALFYVGQLGFIIKFREKYILIDGYLSDYVDRYHEGDAIQMKRRYPVPINPWELDFIDYVFCTHGHCDHADPDTLAGIAKVNNKAKYVVPAGIIELICSFGVPGESVVGVVCDRPESLCEGISFTAIPAAHEELHPDGMGGYLEVGYRLELGEVTLYHSGDCCPYDGLEARVKGSDIMIMPINGRDYYRRYEHNIIGNFDVGEALLLAERSEAKLLVPAHFDMYAPNGQDPAFFVSSLYRMPSPRCFHIFMPGERYIYGA
ncbi:MAG: MBL fold metallo-hydrolase [Clostridia bacterium]|nr:MBL fold metallo-hydrolase [Clostridia bacterium]